MMRAAVIVSAVLVAGPSAAAGAPAQHVATQGELDSSWTLIPCGIKPPPGSQGLFCMRHAATGALPGLGAVSVAFDTSFDYRGTCALLSATNGTVTTRAAGSLRFTVTTPPCRANEPLVRGTVPVAVTGGDGSLAGATGTGVLDIERYLNVTTGCCGSAVASLALSFDAPNANLDLTPPVLAGAHARTVRAPRHAKRARVRYAVTARDAVDGAVPVTCKPASGHLFRIGKTRVACSATDASANTVKAGFTVTVKRTR